jgi:O-antigen ligase
MSSIPPSPTDIAVYRYGSSWYLLVPGLAVFSHALAIDSLFRSLMYANLLLLPALAYRMRHAFTKVALKQAGIIMLAPVVLILLHLLSGGEGASKEIRHLASFTCLALGFILLAQYNRTHPSLVQSARSFAIIFVLSYAAIQSVCVWVLNQPYGTTNNPHYLAQYSMLLLFVGFYLYHDSTALVRAVLVLSMLLLGMLLLHTSSRPAWLGFIITGLFYLFLLQKHYSWKLPALFIGLIFCVYLLNVGDFKDRTDQLLSTLSKEERVTIWKDTLEMQLVSSPRQWIVGHGISSFKADFSQFSHFGSLRHQVTNHFFESDCDLCNKQGGKGINFSAPHNHILELLYTSGIIGLIVIAGLFLAIYQYLIHFWRRGRDLLYPATLISVLTGNTLFGSISVSFFSSYSLLILSIVGSLTLLATDPKST